jgi:hypothetical protein
MPRSAFFVYKIRMTSFSSLHLWISIRRLCHVIWLPVWMNRIAVLTSVHWIFSHVTTQAVTSRDMTACSWGVPQLCLLEPKPRSSTLGIHSHVMLSNDALWSRNDFIIRYAKGNCVIMIPISYGDDWPFLAIRCGAVTIIIQELHETVHLSLVPIFHGTTTFWSLQVDRAPC